MTIASRYASIFGIGMIVWSIIWFLFHNNEQSFGVSLMIGIVILVASILIEIMEVEFE